MFGWLFFHHSIFITHHSLLISLKYHTRLAPSLTCHYSIFFTLFVGLILVTRCSFFFFFPLYPETRTQWKKKRSQKVVKSCGWVLFVGPLCVFNYNIAIELWVMETENSQNEFLVSITHNSKIRELSNGKRVIVCQITFLLWIPPFLSYELWKQRIELLKNPIQTAPKVSMLEGCFWFSRPLLSAYFNLRVSIMEASNTFPI